MNTKNLYISVAILIALYSTSVYVLINIEVHHLLWPVLELGPLIGFMVLVQTVFDVREEKVSGR